VIGERLPEALDGERLDRVVALLADLTRSRAAQLVADGGVRVDGTLERSGKVRLATGSLIEVDLGLLVVPSAPEPDESIDFGVVYVDDDIVVVDKPAGLVVHPGAGREAGTLVNGLLHRFGHLADVGDPVRPGIVHRLDAGSSGLLVVARTDDAATALIRQFADHSATRRYDAVVWGVPSAPHGVIDGPIGRSRRDPLRMAVVAGGRRARTDYQVVQTLVRPARLARLSCRLETGRTHQIRVHLSSIGHPLVGDPVYGQRRPTLGLTRPFLHAAELAFDHPRTGRPMTFESALAGDLAAWLAAAEPAP
jgi:23S rRNA pseudouridine1911/1915/1917 synthase